MEQEQQNELDSFTQSIQEQHAKDLDALQKLGEEMAEKYLEEAKKETEELEKELEKNNKNVTNDINNIVGAPNDNTSNTATISQPSTYNVPADPGVSSGIKIFSFMGMTIYLIISLIISSFLIGLCKRKKDTSKIAKGFYHFIRFGLVLNIVMYLGNSLNMLIPKLLPYYFGGLITALIIYLFFKYGKRRGKGSSNGIIKNEKAQKGIVLGYSDGKLIVKSGEVSGHVLVCGGSGKGKSQCVTIPSLLNWEGAALVVDIKRELYAYTHHVRKSKGKVIVFDPEQNGHSYDPIKECYEVDGCQFLSRSLVPTPPNTDPFWTQSAQAILAAACFEGNKKGQSLPEIAERILITEPQVLVDELTNSQYNESRLLASSLKGTPPNTLGGIFTELKGKLITIATDPNIKNALSKSEWTPETLEEGATIYLRVSERQIEQYKQVFNLIIVQIIRHLASRPEGKSPAILLLIDELPRLGKVEGYASGLTTLRSKNVHFLSAIQSVAQYDLHYGKDNRRTIMDNKAYKLVLSASDSETQKIFSDLAGKEKRKQKSTSVGFGHGSISQYEQWEEKFRPESFAYMERPIYYLPDGPAREVDKAFWMNIPSLVKLQKAAGGPTGFLNEKQIQELSTFKRDTNKISNNMGGAQPEEKEIEKIKEQHKGSSETNDEVDTVEPFEEVAATDESRPGHTELMEKWHVK